MIRDEEIELKIELSVPNTCSIMDEMKELQQSLQNFLRYVVDIEESEYEKLLLIPSLWGSGLPK